MLTAGLGAVWKSLSTILKEGEEIVYSAVIENLSDVGRLLADLQCDESNIRRNLLLSMSNLTAYKKTLSDTTPDERFFGKDFKEKLKAKKA